METLFEASFPAGSEPRPGELVYSSDGLLWAFGRDGLLRAADVRESLGEDGEALSPLHVVRPDPPVEVAEPRLYLNTTRTVAAVVGRVKGAASAIYLVDLSAAKPVTDGGRGRASDARGPLSAQPPPRPAPSTLADRGGPLGGGRPGLSVLWAGWHPVSDGHLVVLTSDGFLRILDASRAGVVVARVDAKAGGGGEASASPSPPPPPLAPLSHRRHPMRRCAKPGRRFGLPSSSDDDDDDDDEDGGGGEEGGGKEGLEDLEGSDGWVEVGGGRRNREGARGAREGTFPATAYPLAAALDPPDAGVWGPFAARLLYPNGSLRTLCPLPGLADSPALASALERAARSARSSDDASTRRWAAWAAGGGGGRPAATPPPPSPAPSPAHPALSAGSGASPRTLVDAWPPAASASALALDQAGPSDGPWFWLASEGGAISAGLLPPATPGFAGDTGAGRSGDDPQTGGAQPLLLLEAVEGGAGGAGGAAAPSPSPSHAPARASDRAPRASLLTSPALAAGVLATFPSLPPVLACFPSLEALRISGGAGGLAGASPPPPPAASTLPPCSTGVLVGDALSGAGVVLATRPPRLLRPAAIARLVGGGGGEPAGPGPDLGPGGAARGPAVAPARSAGEPGGAARARDEADASRRAAASRSSAAAAEADRDLAAAAASLGVAAGRSDARRAVAEALQALAGAGVEGAAARAAALRERAEGLPRATAEALEAAANAGRLVSEAEGKGAALASRVERCRALAESLAGRAEALRELHAALPDPAPSEALARLRDAELPALERAAAETEARAGRAARAAAEAARRAERARRAGAPAAALAAGPPSPPALSPRDSARLHESLQEQEASISAAFAALRALEGALTRAGA